MQYHTSSEYLMVPCEKWYLHPTLLGKLAYNVGNSLCYINYIDGCFWCVNLKVFMQETNVVNKRDARFYWQISSICAIALKLMFLNYHCWTPAKKWRRNTMMLWRSVGRAAVIAIRIVVDTTTMIPIFSFVSVVAFLQYVRSLLAW